MKQRRMGRSGFKVSEICLGTRTFAGQSDEATSVRLLDAADAYPIPPDPESAGRTEEVIGRWLAAPRGRRDRLIVATRRRIKVGHGPNDRGLCRHHVLAAREASLKRLRTDYIDLYKPISPTRRHRSQQPGITSVIVGASRPEQLDATLGATEMILGDDAKAAFDSVWWSIPRRPAGR